MQTQGKNCLWFCKEMTQKSWDKLHFVKRQCWDAFKVYHVPLLLFLLHAHSKWSVDICWGDELIPDASDDFKRIRIFRLIYRENKWIWMGIREVMQVNCKRLGKVSARGKFEQLLGNAARAAIFCSPGKKEGLLPPELSTLCKNC